MSRSLRHGALAATAIVFSIASLSACAAGRDAETLKVRPDNAATSEGKIKVQNVIVITQGEAETEGPAVVSATLFNDGAEAEVLEGITLPGADARVELRSAKGEGPVEIPAGGRVVIGGKGNASAVIDKGHEATRAGNVQQVVFKLSRTGDVGLGAGVVPASGYYEDFGPSSLPETPAPTPSGTPSAGGSEAPAAGTEQQGGAEASPETATG